MSAIAPRRPPAAARASANRDDVVLDAKHVRHARRVLQRLAKRRDALEAARAKQLWGIAKAMDAVAREELRAVSPAPQEPGVADGSIDVAFGEPVADFDAAWAEDDEP